MSTAVEKYLDSKKIEYRLDGNYAMMQCPFCKQSEKFGINIDSWLYQDFRGSCATKGNEITFKRHFGDTVQPVSNLEDDDTPAPTRARSAPEAVPDIEAAHKLLLSNDEVLNWLNDERGFSLETVKEAKLGLGKRKFSDGKVSLSLMFPYFAKGKCVGVKYKSLPPDPKDFRFTSGLDVGLYREDAIKKDMESLIICEGETDVLALVNQGYTNVVGVSGANSKKADWSDLLDLPKKMYLVMDNDESGVTGAKTFATRFGIDRFHIVNIPHLDLIEPVVDKHGTRTTISDVNEFFHSGFSVDEFNELLAAARPFDIEGVTTMDSAFDKLIANLDERGNLDPKYKFLWPSVNLRAKGIEDGDLITLLAPAKTGKTTFMLNQFEFMVLTYGINVHFECMEMSDAQLTKKWAAMYLQVEEDTLTREQLLQAKKAAKEREHGFVFSQSHPKTEDELFDSIRRTKMRYGIGAVVVDNLQLFVDIVLGRGERNNRVSTISAITKKLKLLAVELQVPIFLISQPKGVREGEMVTVNDSEGSTAPQKDSDLFLVMNRNAEVRMKTAQADAVGNLETFQSHSDNVYVEVGLSRRSRGGFCTLKIDGAKSIIREYSSEEIKANTKQGMVNGIAFVDDNQPVAV